MLGMCVERRSIFVAHCQREWVSAYRLAQRTAEDTPTRNRAAAARRELPPDTSATTRARRSSECVPMPASRRKGSIESDQHAQN